MIESHIQTRIYNRAIEELKDMLRTAATMRVQTYLLNTQAERYREFQAETMHLQHSELSGRGIISTRSGNQGEIVEDLIPLANAELCEFLAADSLKAPAASQLFTKLEVFGNDVAEYLEFEIPKGKAWHTEVSGKTDARDINQMEKAGNGFGKYFGFDARDVPLMAVYRLINLKKLRNEIAHYGKLSVDYDDFLSDVLAVVCDIVYLTTDEDRLSVYPFEDHHGHFAPQSRTK